MASINGIEIRSLRSIPNNNGGEAYNGFIWYKKDGNAKAEKLGFWAQNVDSNVRDKFDFDASILDEEVEKYRKSDRVDAKYESECDIEWLLDDLANLVLEEEIFKGLEARGNDACVKITDDTHTLFYGYLYKRFIAKEDLFNSLLHKKNMERFKETAVEGSEAKITVYTSHKDFKIRTLPREYNLGRL